MNVCRILFLGLGLSITLTVSACGEGQSGKGQASGGPITVYITQPSFGFNVLPRSVRRIFATVTNGKTDTVNWSVTGGATLSPSNGHWSM